MKQGVQKALIAAGSSILVAIISIPTAATISVKNYQTNNSSMTINLDGEKVVVTAEKYDEIIRENEAMSKELQTLEKKFKDATKKYDKDESLEIKSEVRHEETKLKNLAQVDSGDYELIEPFTDSYGNQYEIGYRFDTSLNAYVVYGLQGEYNRFSGTIVCSNETGSKTNASMMVYKDDELIDTITGITKQTETRQIGPYDISNARKLTIKTANNGEFNYGYCYLVNASVE